MFALLWHYKGAAVPVDTITSADFFSPAADMLAAGDMLMVSAHDGAATMCVAPGGATMLLAAAHFPQAEKVAA